MGLFDNLFSPFTGSLAQDAANAQIGGFQTAYGLAIRSYRTRFRQSRAAMAKRRGRCSSTTGKRCNRSKQTITSRSPA
jgi:hypothetical protein